MTNYIRGMKRQQIIKKWLQGIDDPEYEVFPTKKEGKYIVKKRTEPLPDQTTDQVNGQSLEEVPDETTDQEEVKSTEESKALSSKSEPPQTPKPRPIPTIPKRIRDSDPQDLTISYEILNQLKELGNEIKQQRIKKEQKSMIKQVVQKQMTKRPHKRVVEQYTSDEDNDEYDQLVDAYAEQPTPKVQTKHKRTESFGGSDSLPPSQPVFKSRIRR